LDMRAWIVGASALFVAACAGGAVPGLLLEAPPEIAASAPHIAAAIADPARPAVDTARDDLRRPADILAFAQVRPGQRLADIGPGGGYYSRLFAVAVGGGGRVFAVDRPGTAERPRPMAAIAPTYPNITHLTDGYANWNAGEPLDTIFISQIYHDFYLQQLNIDIPALNRQMFAALKPGGALIIIDHAAPDGAAVGTDGQSASHRIDQAQVVRDLAAAGFVLEAETQVLRNPADNRTLRVFEGDIRGRTDQFVLRFRKGE
jgi:predicted methyltransferase